MTRGIRLTQAEKEARAEQALAIIAAAAEYAGNHQAVE